MSRRSYVPDRGDIVDRSLRDGRHLFFFLQIVPNQDEPFVQRSIGPCANPGGTRPIRVSFPNQAE